MKSMAASAITMPATRAGLTPRSKDWVSSATAKLYGWSGRGGAIHEPVPHPGLGDEPRRRGVVPELLADLAGVHASVLRLAAVLRSPHLLQDRSVRQHTTRIAGEQREEAELFQREVDQLSTDGHLMIRHVDDHVADCEDRVGDFALPGGLA